jgi:hypothetical protein
VPVSISLLELVSVDGTRPLWPTDFAALVTEIEADPTNKDRWFVLAGWLEEFGEPELSGAIMYAHKRDEIELKCSGDGNYRYWTLNGVKYGLSAFPVDRADHHTAAGPFAELAKQIAAARKDLE